MSQVRGGGDHIYDNLPTIEPLTAQTGNLNGASTLSQDLHLQKGETKEQGLFHETPLSNTGRSKDEEEEKVGNAEKNRDDEEEDLDEVMNEEDEDEDDLSVGSASLICCQSPDTPMTDSSCSETGTEHTHFCHAFSTAEALHLPFLLCSCLMYCVNILLSRNIMHTQI